MRGFRAFPLPHPERCRRIEPESSTQNTALRFEAVPAPTIRMMPNTCDTTFSRYGWSAVGCRSPGAKPRTSFRPAQATQNDPKRPARMSAASHHVALLIAANELAFDSPMLKNKSFGGKADGTYPKIRGTPSMPVTSSHPASPPLMILSWDPLTFLPTNNSGYGSRAMMLPSRSAINFDDVGGNPLSLR